LQLISDGSGNTLLQLNPDADDINWRTILVLDGHAPTISPTPISAA